MSIKIRKAQLASESPVVAAINALLDANLSTQVHRDKTATPAGDALNPSSTVLTVSAANATDLATSLTLVNNIKGVLAVHLADTSAHLEADTTNDNFDGYALGTDLASAILLANAIKVDYTAHIASTVFHVNADSTNTVSASAATDQSSLNTLLNEVKGDLTAHIADGGSVQRLVLIDD